MMAVHEQVRTKMALPAKMLAEVASHIEHGCLLLARSPLSVPWDSSKVHVSLTHRQRGDAKQLARHQH